MIEQKESKGVKHQGDELAQFREQPFDGWTREPKVRNCTSALIENTEVYRPAVVARFVAPPFKASYRRELHTFPRSIVCNYTEQKKRHEG